MAKRASAVRATVLAVVLVMLLAASAAATTYQFRVVSASEQSIISGTKNGGCISGSRQYDFSTATALEDPQSAYSEDDQFGTLRSAKGAASLSNDKVANSCDPSHPCTYNYGPATLQGASVGMALQPAADPAQLTVSSVPFATEMGDVAVDACSAEATVNFPYGEPSGLVDKAQLFSGDPVDVVISGSKHFSQSNIGDPIDVTVSYTMRMTVQALTSDLKITVGEAGNEDQGGPSGRWNPSFPVSWHDTPCTDPAAGTSSPRAYVIAGAKRSPLASLLGTAEDSLPGAAGFAGNNLKLTKSISVLTPPTIGANGAKWLAVMAAAHRPAPLDPGRGVFYGARIACKTAASPSKFVVAKSDVLPICHDRSSLSGTAWTGLKPEMQDALGRLWKVLQPLHACYSPSSGFRSQDQQDALRDHWHAIADHPKGDHRSAAQIHTALQSAGFAQDPAGYQGANGSGVRVAKGGPALFSMHSLGVAADVHVEFSDTGVFEENLAKLQAAAAQAGLCGPPASDRVHVELPFVAGTDPVTHFPTVVGVTAVNGQQPRCSTFTDVRAPKPTVDAKRAGNSIQTTTSSPVGSSVTVGGTASTPGASRVYKLKAVRRRARAGAPTKIRVRLPAALRGRLGHHKVSVRLRVVVDYGGAIVVKQVALTL